MSTPDYAVVSPSVPRSGRRRVRAHVAVPLEGAAQRHVDMLCAFLDNPFSDSAQDIRRQLLEDKEAVFESLFRIVPKDALMPIPFRLRAGQRLLLSTIESFADKPVRIIIVKARQLGVSTLIAVYNFLYALLTPYSHACVMADTKDKGEGLFRIYERLYKFLPDPVRPILESKIQRRHMWFADPLGSGVRVLVAEEASADDVGSTGRSATIQRAHLSELPWYANPLATLNALLEAVPYSQDTAVIIESTARSANDLLRTRWDMAHQKGSDYVPVFIPWFMDDGEYRRHFDTPEDRDEFEAGIGHKTSDRYGNERLIMENHPDITLDHLNWRRHKIDDKNGDISSFQREYPSTPEEAFRGSVSSWINPVIMEHYFKSAEVPIAQGDFGVPDYLKTRMVYDEELGIGEQQNLQTLIESEAPPSFEAMPLGYCKIWQHPEPYCEYIISTDSGDSKSGRDWSVAEVYRRMPEGIVAEIRGSDERNITQTEFAWQVYWAARYYNMAWVNPERNLGGVVVGVLRDTVRYGRLMYSRDLRIGGQRLSYNDEHVGWWFSRRLIKTLRDWAQEWFEGDRTSPSFIGKYCPNKGLLIEVSNSVVEESGHVVARYKHLERREGQPEEGYYDDRVYAFFGCLLADESLPMARPPRMVQEREAEDQTRVERSKPKRRFSGRLPAWWF